ncbi:MAG: chorismate synthase [Nitrospiraceae bacterium]|nr:MAG: chorismate synthase [Nitrospiraceae bacterium]
MRYLTSGESHGRALLCTIDGVPSNLMLLEDDINNDLARRQRGYGRGGRMKIESDRAEILSGVRHGITMGSPVSLLIENRDWENWQDIMSPEPAARRLEQGRLAIRSRDPRKLPVTRPRPGHADLPGALKYGHRDLRNVLERSSARETAARVAVGAIAKKLLAVFGIEVMSYVTEVGGICIENTGRRSQITDVKKVLSLFKRAEASEVRCPDKKTEEKIVNRITTAMRNGDTLGGVFEVIVTGVPAGLGSYSQWDRKLDARLSYAIMAIQAVKGVEVGLGFETARRRGSDVMDEIYYRTQKPGTRAKTARGEAAGGFYRKTNNAGGIEGGMSNGMPIVIRAAMKPIPTLRRPLSSVDIESKKTFRAAYERSDVCAVPAASVIGEAVTAISIADSFLAKFGGDSLEEIGRNYRGYLRQMREF